MNRMETYWQKLNRSPNLMIKKKKNLNKSQQKSTNKAKR